MPPLPRNMGAVILSWDFDDYGQKARRLGSTLVECGACLDDLFVSVRAPDCAAYLFFPSPKTYVALRKLPSGINLFLTHIKFEDPQLSHLGNTTPPLKHLGYQTNKRPYGEDFVVYTTPLIVTPSNACS
ncbi:uncharacterized protein QC763_0102350 [Podospora pseudopauciseta]|uniref:Uncharacterized protein n=1 Tax=Podospora pseudopauciseta TaxID=2093780 RepID=A0ABR0H027_9PEZI|nr:hypothetical protein QC763_0102350 [Podospora pseudopauciseta]